MVLTQQSSKLCIWYGNSVYTWCYSWDNRADYVKLLREKRIEELASKERISAIKCGLATIIPLEVLSVFSEEDLDLRVCGIPEVDLDYLKVCIMVGVLSYYCMCYIYADTYDVSSWSDGD